MYNFGLSNIYPSSGSMNGGTLLTATGTGFSATTKFLFGDKEAEDVTLVSSTKITCKTPSVGSVVEVVNNGAGGCF